MIITSTTRGTCGRCGQRIDSTMSTCPHCGAHLAGARCPTCGFAGALSEFVDNRCPKCGVHVQINNEIQQSNSTRSKTTAQPATTAKPQLKPIEQIMLFLATIMLIGGCILTYTTFINLKTFQYNPELVYLFGGLALIIIATGIISTQIMSLKSRVMGKTYSESKPGNEKKLPENSDKPSATKPRARWNVRTILTAAGTIFLVSACPLMTVALWTRDGNYTILAIATGLLFLAIILLAPFFIRVVQRIRKTAKTE